MLKKDEGFDRKFGVIFAAVTASLHSRKKRAFHGCATAPASSLRCGGRCAPFQSLVRRTRRS